MQEQPRINPEHELTEASDLGGSFEAAKTSLELITYRKEFEPNNFKKVISDLALASGINKSSTPSQKQDAYDSILSQLNVTEISEDEMTALYRTFKPKKRKSR